MVLTVIGVDAKHDVELTTTIEEERNARDQRGDDNIATNSTADATTAAQLRLNSATVILLVIAADWLTDSASFINSLHEIDKSLIAKLSLFPVTVGFLFNSPLIWCHMIAIWKGLEYPNMKSDCLRLEFLHAVFESIPEVVLNSLKISAGNKNGWDIASIVCSVLFIIFTVLKLFYLPEYYGMKGVKKLLKLLMRRMAVLLSVTVMLLNLYSCIHFYLDYKNERPPFYAEAIGGEKTRLFFVHGIVSVVSLLLVCARMMVLLCPPPIYLWKSKGTDVETGFKQNLSHSSVEGNGEFTILEKWFDYKSNILYFQWILTLYSTAVMINIMMETKKDLVFVIVIAVLVIIYTAIFMPRLLLLLPILIFIASPLFTSILSFVVLACLAVASRCPRLVCTTRPSDKP